MSINSIETQDVNRSPFGTIAKGSVGGGIIGYAAKHMLPLSENEMGEDFKGVVAVIREQSNKAKASAIETIRNIKDKTLAQDTFIKMVDSESTNSAIKDAKIAKAFSMRKVAKDANLAAGDMIELRGIIAGVNKKAGNMYKQCIKGYESAVKNRRVTPIYIAAGAVLGFFTGLGQSIFRSSNV